MDIKKVTQKDRYGNQVSFEFEAPVKPLDQTAIVKGMMEKSMDESMEMPMMSIGIDHPGEPKGTDTVPAWLTPGEFVVNKEAMDIPGNAEKVEQINDQGRAIQAKKGMHVPGYQHGGQIPTQFLAQPIMYKNDGGWITDALLDRLREVESGGRNDLVSKAGAVGEYQWLPSSAKQAGYGVKAFDPLDPKASRAATAKYLRNMQKHHGFTPEETLRAYNWGPGNVLKYKAGKRKDIPDEALNYPGKILGFDKVEGVDVPYDMPVPTARPGKDILNTIRVHEQPGETASDKIPDIKNPDTGRIREIPTVEDDGEGDSILNSIMNQDVLKAFLDKYLAHGGKVNHLQPGGYPNANLDVIPEVYDDAILRQVAKPEPVNYKDIAQSIALEGEEDVDKPSNVVPALTDVPGNPMYDSESNVVKPEDDSKWWHNLLGHRSKEALNIPLTGENEKRLANESYKDYHAFNPSLVGDDPVGELSAGDIEGTGQVGDNKITSVTGDALVGQVDDFDMKHKKEVKEDIKDKVLNKLDSNTKKADGPGEDQAGENKSEAEVKKAGESNPDMVAKATSFLKDTFGDLFDTKELARMGVMYAGSRLLGYGHQGSLRFAAKNYIKRVDAKFANRDSFIKTNAKNFTPASLEAYRKSGDLSQLVKPGTPANRTGEFKTFYGPSGAVKAEKIKVGDNTMWSTDGGKTFIDGTKFNEDPAYIKGTKENKSMVNNFISRTTDQLKSLRGQFDRFGTGDEIGYNTDINPATSSGKIAEWAVKNGVKPEELSGLVESAYHDAINDKRQDGSRARNLVPYLNQLIIRQKVGNPDLFLAKGYDPEDKGAKQYVNAQKLQTLNRSVAHVMKGKGMEGGTQDLANQFYNAALRDWNKLSTKEQESYIGKALDDESGFYKFIEMQALKYAQ